MSDTTYTTDPPEWALGEFFSSAQRPRKVLMVATGKPQIREYERHKDFIRWVSAGKGYVPPEPPEPPGKVTYYNLNDEVSVTLSEYGALHYYVHFKGVPSQYLAKLGEGSEWKGPMWEAMQIWGDLMFNGQLPKRMPFKDMRYGIRRQT